MVDGLRRRRERVAAKIGGAAKITDPACRGAAYIKPNATALDIWYGVYLANLIASTGHFVPQITDADAAERRATRASPQLPVDASLPEAARAAARQDKLLAALGKDPHSPFGSNATAIGGDDTTTGRGDAARQPALPVARPLPVHPAAAHDPRRSTTSPGASLIGSPVVNIGWNKNVAWSHTVSTAYRFTPYEYQTAGRHRHVVPHHRRRQAARASATSHVTVKNADGSLSTVTEDLYRTDQGYVLDAPGHVDELDADQLLRDPRRQRRAAAHDRHLPRHGQGHRRPRPARAPGQGRRHAVGEHHRRRPRRRRAVRRPLGRTQRPQRPRRSSA